MFFPVWNVSFESRLFLFLLVAKGGNSQEFVTVIAMNLPENFRIIRSAALKEVALQIYLCLKAKCLQGITPTRAWLPVNAS
jgi:hypothetical protein